MSTFATYAQDYIGVDAVLKRVQDANAKPSEKSAPDAQSVLREDLKAFSQSSSNLTPAAAAAQWLALVDRATKMSHRNPFSSGGTVRPITSDEIMASLPPPTSWLELSKAIATRPPGKVEDELRETGLRFLAATLNGDNEGRTREITSLSSKAASTAQNAIFYRQFIQEYSQAALQISDDPNIILKSLERQVAYAGQGSPQVLSLPNLLVQVGPEKTEAFLRKALVTPNITFQFNQPGKTSALAQKLALELMDQLKAPQWGLINSLDAVALYEAMDKRFGNETNVDADASIPGLPPGANVQMNDFTGGFEKNQARAFYMLGLISKDRAKEAVAVAKKFTGPINEYELAEAFKAMERAGFTGALDNFLNELLSQDPTLPFWDQYVDLAAKAGQTERMLALVRTTVTREDLTDKNKANLRRILFKARLAADQVDEGVEEIRKLIALNTVEESPGAYNVGQLGVLMATIGQLLQKPEWTAEGVEAAKKWVSTNSEKMNPFSMYSGGGDVLGPLTKILFELKRGPEAEVILADALAKATRPNPDPALRMYNFQGGAARPILVQLATLYYRAGRHQDVLQLLQQSPDWGAKDLGELFGASVEEEQMRLMGLHTAVSPLPVPYLAANALLATGKRDVAVKITDSLLDSYPGLDRGYELLVAIRGSNAIPRLHELFARDQFEERPLIWEAHILRLQNQLDQAEKIIRQAIAIDPSDGEEGRGDRMRAYAELADILAARGNTNDANTYRGAVTAIRLSEDADQFYTAGLLKRAIAMYQEGLKHFADAYCIQSRLAIQLSALGMNEAAEEHYRRAYELMPDSFGRVESHCFGCERAFDGERAQNLAEQVFTKIAAQRPEKPQIHYLLGYLHQEEEKFNEARTNYLDAVHLDPDYLNAWVKLQEVVEQTLLPPEKRDEIAFNILRLDPLQRHSHPSYERVGDLTKLWNAAAVAASHQIPPATNLFELTASKTALEKKAQKTSNDPNQEEAISQIEMENYMNQSEGTISPARAVGQTPFVRLAGQMIVGGNPMVEY